MLYGEFEESAFDFLPEDERDEFHFINCPAHQVGYYDKAIGQELNH